MEKRGRQEPEGYFIVKESSSLFPLSISSPLLT
jgi:hypothetical protein